MKKLIFFLSIIVTGVIIQLDFITSDPSSDISLNQLVQKAEACIEITGEDHLCCPCDLIICYIGGGYWLEDHIESHG